MSLDSLQCLWNGTFGALLAAIKLSPFILKMDSSLLEIGQVNSLGKGYFMKNHKQNVMV